MPRDSDTEEQVKNFLPSHQTIIPRRPAETALRRFLALLCWFAALPCIANAAAPAMHFGADWRPLDLHTCTGEAMQAMIRQRFIGANREPAYTSGFNEQSVVLVRCVEQGKGVHIEVLAISHSSQEAERLRNQIRTSVFGARLASADMLFPTLFNGDSAVPGHAPPRPINHPQLHWGADTRPKSQQACVRDAAVAMARSGLQASVNGTALVWGRSNQAAVLVSCVPIPTGVSIMVAAASDDSALAERLRNAVRSWTFDQR
jgi:hypothetical protein